MFKLCVQRKGTVFDILISTYETLVEALAKGDDDINMYVQMSGLDAGIYRMSIKDINNEPVVKSQFAIQRTN